MRTSVANLAGAQIAGAFSTLKVLGVHLSVADRGVTFGSNANSGVSIRLRRPVPGIEPLGLLCHPGVTVTVNDSNALAHALAHAAAQRTASKPG